MGTYPVQCNRVARDLCTHELLVQEADLTKVGIFVSNVLGKPERWQACFANLGEVTG